MRHLVRLWNYLKSPGPMAVIALIGIAFGIFQTFVYEKRGELIVSVRSLSRVIDLHDESVGGLQIAYAGEDLRVSKKVLWVMSLAISNLGNSEIRKVDYDEQVPLGFQAIGADLVETPVVKTSNDYLAQNLKIKVEKSRVSLSPVILEPNDFVNIDILLLGPESSKPTIKTLGKVAGIKDIQLQTSESTQSNKPFWSQIFDTGTVWLYPARMFIYFFAFLLFAALLGVLGTFVALPIEKLTSIRGRAVRQERMSRFLRRKELSATSETLADLYVKHGETLLLELDKLLKEVDGRLELIDQLSKGVNIERAAAIAKKLEPIRSRASSVVEEAGLLTFEKGRPTSSPDLKNGLTDIATYLKIDFAEGAASEGA